MDDALANPWDRDGGQGAIRICPDPDDTSKWHRWLWNTGPDSVVNTKQGINPAFFEIKRAGYYRLWSKGREAGSRFRPDFTDPYSRFQHANRNRREPTSR